MIYYHIETKWFFSLKQLNLPCISNNILMYSIYYDSISLYSKINFHLLSKERRTLYSIGIHHSATSSMERIYYKIGNPACVLLFFRLNIPSHIYPSMYFNRILLLCVILATSGNNLTRNSFLSSPNVIKMYSM